MLHVSTPNRPPRRLNGPLCRDPRVSGLSGELTRAPKSRRSVLREALLKVRLYARRQDLRSGQREFCCISTYMATPIKPEQAQKPPVLLFH